MQIIRLFDEKVEELFSIERELIGEKQGTIERQALLRTEYEKKKLEVIPRVMLFGSYNAGKSTLINALLKQESAKTDDVPTTAEIAEYESIGCYLQDTPGINAPIEHEDVTREHIDRSQLLLFVIRQGDQDVNAVYECMFDLLKKDKNLFIVYNHALPPDELATALNKLNTVLIKFAANKGIDDTVIGSVPVIAMNVKTALKAAIKGSEPLAEHSGLLEFENRFKDWLSQFDGEHHYIESVRQFILNRLLNPVIEATQQHNDDKTDEQLQTLQIQQQLLLKRFDLIIAKVTNFIHATVNSRKVHIEGLLSSYSSQTKLESEVQQMAMDVMGETSEYVQQEYEAFTRELHSPIELDSFDFGEQEGSAVKALIGSAVLSGLKRMDKGAIKEGLLYLRKMKIPFFKGRWGKTFDKWAGRAAPAVAVLTTAWQVYSASAEQDKQNEAMRQQKIALYQAIESIASTISVAIKKEVISHFEQVRDDSLAPIQNDIDALIGRQSFEDQKRAQLEKINTALQLLRT